MDINFYNKKGFFPSIKLKRFKLLKEKPQESVRHLFRERNCSQEEGKQIDDKFLKQFCTQVWKNDLSCESGLCINFKRVQLKNLEQEHKEKQVRMRGKSIMGKNKRCHSHQSETRWKMGSNSVVLSMKQSKSQKKAENMSYLNVKANKIKKFKTEGQADQKLKEALFKNRQIRRNNKIMIKQQKILSEISQDLSRFSPWERENNEIFSNFQ